MTNYIINNIDFVLRLEGKSRAEFAQLIGVSPKKVSNWFTGVSKISLEDAMFIAQKLSLSLDKLVYDRIDDPYQQYHDFVRKNHPQLLNDSGNEESGYKPEGEDLLEKVKDSNEKITDIYNMLFNAENKILFDKALDDLNRARIKTNRQKEE